MNELFDIKGDSALARLSSKSNEWYTPAKYVNAARLVMGGIDTDPASCAVANKTVQAGAYYDLETNGLEKPWRGRVWLNPPYGRTDLKSNQEIWSCRLIQQYDAGITQQAVLLVTARVEAKWFQRLWSYPVCLTDHRINFHSETSGGGSTVGSAFVYFGSHEEAFISTFSVFGVVVRRVSPRLQPALWEGGVTW